MRPAAAPRDTADDAMLDAEAMAPAFVSPPTTRLLRHAPAGAARRARYATSVLAVAAATCAPCCSRPDRGPEPASSSGDAASIALCIETCDRTRRCGLELVDMGDEHLPATERQTSRTRAEAAAAQDEAGCEAACRGRFGAGTGSLDARAAARCLPEPDCGRFLACLAADLG